MASVYSVLAFRNEPALQYVFAKFNTGVPSSASVERMFSMGKDVLRAKRATLSESGSGTSSIKGEGGGHCRLFVPFFPCNAHRANVKMPKSKGARCAGAPPPPRSAAYALRCQPGTSSVREGQPASGRGQVMRISTTRRSKV